VIETHSNNSYGIFARSVGGFDESTGGGGGGSALGLYVFGGSAGSGGAGGTVSVNNRGRVATFADGSTAVLAESIGGGGGNGGAAVSAGAYVSFAWGGSGGAGGDGGDVTVDSRGGTISTAGENATGIQGSSIGGGGGNGGLAVSIAVGDKGALSFARGGDGEKGGKGGKVAVLADGAVSTQGSGAPGIAAESIGGGGGSGGNSISVAASTGYSISASVGGKGAEGGAGDTVTVGDKLDPIRGAIATTGDWSSGIHALSIGGGGGSGGLAVAASVSISGPVSVSLGVGGDGGDGGSGGTVTVVSQADITTNGMSSHGIRAQSTSDGGGDGGFAFSGAGAFGGVPKSFSLSVGGDGGKGGAAGAVEVASQGVLATWGSGSHGIYANSVGGGGGAGGTSISTAVGLGAGSSDKSWSITSAFSVGGNGGEGGAGGNVSVGTVTLPLSGQIETHGNGSHGVVAQSIGGGGGQGGSSLVLKFDNDLALGDENSSLTLTGAFGGIGGKGNIGGAVDVINDSAIRTFGDISHGIFAQSIGGGGGSGGSAEAISLSGSGLLPLKDTEVTSWGIELSAGGNGGDGNKGGKVSVVNRGSISTEGELSRGILAQSVGGGGGSLVDGILGKVGDWVDAAGDVLSALEIAKTLHEAYKEGELSGLVPHSLSVTVGASGGVSADGEKVSVDNQGDISTKGLEGHAIFVQSIGGGGGEAQAYAKGKGQGEDADVGIGLLGEIAIGGAGGAAGNGGEVDIVHGGRIVTSGAGAYGIYAQSIGGGGGQAGSIGGGFSDLDSIGFGAAFGRDGGSGGDGGLVTVLSSGDFTTYGTSAIGIFAQSVGGGGGVRGGVDGMFAGSVGGYGAAGVVEVSHSGNVITHGENAHGIFAQSAAGLAGDLTKLVEVIPGLPPVTFVIGTYAGKSADTTVTLSGSIDTQGVDSVGILAQSRGEAGAGNVAIKIDSGGVRGGSGEGAGVKFLDGKDNTLLNRGMISALSGNAIVGGDQNEAVDNYGTVSGSVMLGGGVNRFTNHHGAVFESGEVVDLGAGTGLNSSGTLSPGGIGKAQATALTSSFRQAADGTMVIDIDLSGGAGDRLDISGTALLAGELKVRPMQSGRALPGSRESAFISAAGGLADAGLLFDAPASAIVSYGSPRVTANGITLPYEVDFTPGPVGAFSGNALHVAEHVSAIQRAGGSESFAPIAAALVDLPDALSLNAAYQQLIPESLATLTTETAVASVAFNDAMHSCRQQDGDHRFVREGECRWLRVDGATRSRDDTRRSPGYRLDIFSIAGGVQQELAADTHVGYGLSFQQSDLDASLTDIGGKQVEGGLILKRRYDATMVSGSVSAGYGWYDTRRDVSLPTPGVSASSKQDIYFASIHGRISHDFEQEPNRYVRPLVDLGVTQVHRKGFKEKGAGGANLTVDGDDETLVTLQPAIEFGSEVRRDTGTLIRPYARIGITRYLTDNKRRVTARLQGAPASVAPFTVETEGDRTFVDLSMGMDVIKREGASLRLGYTGQFSDNSSSHAVLLKLHVPF
jgi:hypothetical protein